ncbi:MAG TPA: efflux RND transporter permease subunit [Candidatus Acidoferrales bacterium]|nr:efflux RND transporter permease subunit [Candidatus Acidoferrales bacterium]
MKPDNDNNSRNVARFFTHNRQIAWVALVATLVWGVFGYMNMPKRKDPDIPVRIALAICPWPGIPADKVEQLVTRKIEQAATGNSKVDRVESTTQDNISVVTVRLLDNIQNTQQEFQDIGQRLNQITDLPQGAGPITWISDFGDTAALMLTVASPPVPETEVELRALGVRDAIEKARGGEQGRVSALYCYPSSVSPATIERPFAILATQVQRDGFGTDIHPFSAGSCSGIDFVTSKSDDEIRAYGQQFIEKRLQEYDFHPDAWGPILIRDPQATKQRILEVASGRYSYRQLDDYTDLIQRTLQRVPEVAKVQRQGVLPEEIFLEYSDDRLAAFKLQPSKIKEILNSRNVIAPGGIIQTQSRNVLIDSTAEFKSTKEIGNVQIGASPTGVPVYLRDLVDVKRDYQSPRRYLNFLNTHDEKGSWHRNRAITLAVQMRSGEQIGKFGVAVDKALASVRPQLPADLIVARTSDQPKQVQELVSLLMSSLYEAIALVVIVALVGFWDWRAAMLMAASIPLTLAMTFGIIHVINIDIQQVSIATLIIALGLLVDMPVVAGDAIKRELGGGAPNHLAAWLGPTKLAKAIIFATITNIVAYLPFLLLTGDTYFFLYSLPVVMTCTLIASVIVSFTFIPLIAYYLIKAPRVAEEPMAQRRTHGFAGAYYKLGDFCLGHRWGVFAGSLLVLVLGGVFMKALHPQFFPKDLSYLSYVDVWLPPDAPLGATNAVCQRAEAVIRQESERFGQEHHDKDVLKSMTTFVGGGGPRFWFSVDPEQQQLNYAQILVEVSDKHFTNELVGPLQTALSREVPGARIDVRQLETGKPVGIPVSIRISGENIDVLHRLSAEMQSILRSQPGSARVRDDWGEPAMNVRLKVDPDRANLSGVTNLDVALSSAAAISGLPVSTFRERDKQIDIAVRLRMEERAGLSDVQNTYVYSGTSNQRVPLRQVSQVTTDMSVSKIKRRNQFRTVTVSAFPIPGILPSQVLTPLLPKIKEFQDHLPPGYFLEIGGEYDEQVKGFKQLSTVMAISVVLIYVALVLQFKNAIKPFLVFAAIPYGMTGAFAGLYIMGQPFGFMGFLGVASLVGVIVSHVIVLFDFIEEAHEKGEPLRQALLDAGIVRLRPVMITVGATVLGLVPLAMHGGPLWEPLCYAQIGGLTIATFVTLILVPVLYSIFVLDLKLIKWEKHVPAEESEAAVQTGGA